MSNSNSKGHPKGLYPLFFTEMWERLAFYIMVGILFLYAIDSERGGLGLSLGDAAEVYGTYLAFVYFTPFLGGMIADRFLGYRRAIVIGGIMMAAGLFSLGVRSMPTFYAGLVLLCLGNGLFKPNISAMVGNLYAPEDSRRDAGFNIFYMGINIGAAFAAIVSTIARNMWDFNFAFMAAGVGLLIGVAVLLGNWKKLEKADIRHEPGPDDITFGKITLVILLPALLFGIAGYFIGANVEAIKSTVGPITFGFIIGMLPIIGYFVMLVKTASPEEKPGLGALMPVYVAGGTFFMILHLSGGLMTNFVEYNTDRQAEWIPNVTPVKYFRQDAKPSYFGNAAAELPRPSEDVLVVVEDDIASMFGQKTVDEKSLAAALKAHPEVALLQTDADGYNAAWGEIKIFKDGVVKVNKDKDSHGVEVTQVKVEPETTAPLKKIALVKTVDGKKFSVIPVSKEMYESVYEGASKERLEPGKSIGLVTAEMVTAFFNPVFVVMLTPLVVAFFAWRLRKGKGVSTARKIFIGMMITTISLGIMAFAASLGGDGASKISPLWVIFYYAVITTGELCLSPMGLSLVTKLSPKRLVGLMMGGWFLSTAIGNKLSGFISGLPPTTMMFIVLGISVLLVALFILAILPRLDKAIKKYGA